MVVRMDLQHLLDVAKTLPDPNNCDDSVLKIKLSKSFSFKRVFFEEENTIRWVIEVEYYDWDNCNR